MRNKEVLKDEILKVLIGICRILRIITVIFFVGSVVQLIFDISVTNLIIASIAYVATRITAITKKAIKDELNGGDLSDENPDQNKKKKTKKEIFRPRLNLPHTQNPVYVNGKEDEEENKIEVKKVLSWFGGCLVNSVTKKIIAMCLAVALIVAAIFIGNPNIFKKTESVESLVALFERSINEEDIDAFIGCLSKETQLKYISNVLSIKIADLVGADDEVTAEIMDFGFGIEHKGNPVELEIVNIEYAEDAQSATVYLVYLSGETSAEIVLPVIYTSDGWYFHPDVMAFCD